MIINKKSSKNYYKSSHILFLLLITLSNFASQIVAQQSFWSQFGLGDWVNSQTSQQKANLELAEKRNPNSNTGSKNAGGDGDNNISGGSSGGSSEEKLTQRAQNFKRNGVNSVVNNSNSLENSIKKILNKNLQDPNGKITKSQNSANSNSALGRSLSSSLQIPFTDLCASRPENNQCCEADDLCQSSSQICECDAACIDRNDCCADYINLCQNAIPVPTCSSNENPADPVIGYISGDPHYQSFDGRTLAYQGACAYTITKLCDQSLENLSENRRFFEISARNEKRPTPTQTNLEEIKVTWTKDIWLTYLHRETQTNVKVEILKGRIATFNGQVINNLPFSRPDLYDLVIYREGRFLTVQTNFGVTLKFDGDGTAQVHLNCQYADNVCGLLGNANGNPIDDYQTPDGQNIDIKNTENGKKMYGDSWLLSSEDKDYCDKNTEEPVCSEAELGEAVKLCEKVAAAPFDYCHDAVQYSNILMNCMYDTCSSQDKSIYCYHLQSYYDQCQLAKKDNFNEFSWRNTSNCPLTCSKENEIYKSCGCDSSCDSGRCDSKISCSEGCFCKEGYVRNPSNDECVREDTCRCTTVPSLPDISLATGNTIITSNCTQKCKCEDAVGGLVRGFGFGTCIFFNY